MPIDFSSARSLADSIRPLLETASFSDGQVESLRRVVAKDNVSIHSIERSSLSDEGKAVAALLMLMRQSPKDARWARVSNNLGELFDKIFNDKAASYLDLLRAHSVTNPFEGTDTLEVRNIKPDGFDLVGPDLLVPSISKNADGNIDLTDIVNWSPDALTLAVKQIRAARHTEADPIQNHFINRLVEVEGDILTQAQRALSAQLTAKKKDLESSAQLVGGAVKKPKAPPHEVAQANIDAIGVALDGVPANPGDDDRPLGYNVQQLKQVIGDALSAISRDEAEAVIDAMQRVGNEPLSLAVVRQAGISTRALALLTVVRAIDRCVTDAPVQEALHNAPNAMEAAKTLIAGYVLDAELEKMRSDLEAFDPMKLYEGAKLEGATQYDYYRRPSTAELTRTSTISDIAARSGEAGIDAYALEVESQGTFVLTGATVETPAMEPTPFTNLSMDSLQILIGVLTGATPDRASGLLASFRRSEEQQLGGLAMATVIDNLCAVLTNKVQASLVEIRKKAEVLEPLNIFNEAKS